MSNPLKTTLGKHEAYPPGYVDTKLRVPILSLNTFNLLQVFATIIITLATSNTLLLAIGSSMSIITTGCLLAYDFAFKAPTKKSSERNHSIVIAIFIILGLAAVVMNLQVFGTYLGKASLAFQDRYPTRYAEGIRLQMNNPQTGIEPLKYQDAIHFAKKYPDGKISEKEYISQIAKIRKENSSPIIIDIWLSSVLLIAFIFFNWGALRVTNTLWPPTPRITRLDKYIQNIFSHQKTSSS